MKVGMKIVINYSRVNDNIDFNDNDVDYDDDKVKSIKYCINI
jgi:hypothetical protein